MRPVILLTILTILGGCASQPEVGDAPTAESACEPATAEVLEAIAQGLTTEGEERSLRSGFAVKSNDYESVYFIAADIQAAGLEGADDIGVWATNSPDGAGLILSVDNVAIELSEWPDGSKTDAELSMSDHGAGEVKECAAQG